MNRISSILELSRRWFPRVAWQIFQQQLTPCRRKCVVWSDFYNNGSKYRQWSTTIMGVGGSYAISLTDPRQLLISWRRWSFIAADRHVQFAPSFWTPGPAAMATRAATKPVILCSGTVPVHIHLSIPWVYILKRQDISPSTLLQNATFETFKLDGTRMCHICADYEIRLWGIQTA